MHRGLGVLWGHPHWNPLECGWEAELRFDDLVRYACAKHIDVANDASWVSIRSALVYAFVDRFIEKRQELTFSALDSVVARSCKHIRTKLEDHTLVVPCRLWSQGIPDEIPIGPVTFHRAQKFLADGAIKHGGVTSTSSKWSEEAAAFARESGWVAILTIPHVDATVALDRARRAIDSAINVLRILLGPERTRQVRRAESWGPPGSHSYFRLMPDRSMRVTATWGGREDLMWENWPKLVFGGTADAIREWAGASIHGLTNPQQRFPLQQRFLDALKWYGDAVQEHSCAARIAKCVFAWERLVVASDRPPPPGVGQTEIVSERVAKLCEYSDGEVGSELRKQIRKHYDIRSRLAHGSKSPWADQQLELFAAACEKLTARALVGSLRHYLELRGGAGTDEELEKTFATGERADASGE